jgi:hypothetical protein
MLRRSAGFLSSKLLQSPLANMDSIATVQPGTEPTHDKNINEIGVDEEDAIRKVEEANMPSQSAQEGVREVEAVTLAWTKTSLACAFVWYVLISPSW